MGHVSCGGDEGDAWEPCKQSLQALTWCLTWAGGWQGGQPSLRLPCCCICCLNMQESCSCSLGLQSWPTALQAGSSALLLHPLSVLPTATFQPTPTMSHDNAVMVMVLRSYELLDDRLSSAWHGDTSAVEGVPAALQVTQAHTASFETMIERCLDLPPSNVAPPAMSQLTVERLRRLWARASPST